MEKNKIFLTLLIVLLGAVLISFLFAFFQEDNALGESQSESQALDYHLGGMNLLIGLKSRLFVLSIFTFLTFSGVVVLLLRNYNLL